MLLSLLIFYINGVNTACNKAFKLKHILKVVKESTFLFIYNKTNFFWTFLPWNNTNMEYFSSKKNVLHQPHFKRILCVKTTKTIHESFKHTISRTIFFTNRRSLAGWCMTQDHVADFSLTLRDSVSCIHPEMEFRVAHF
jgi:hypothetical protein